MRALKNSPAAAAALPYIAGMVIAHFINLPSAWLWGVLTVGLLTMFVTHRFSQSALFTLAAAFALICAGSLVFHEHNRPLPEDDVCGFADLPVLTTIEGVICTPMESSGQCKIAVLAVDSVWVLGEGFRASGRCLIKFYESVTDIDYGDRIVARGQLRLPSGERNPGEFNYRRHLAAQHIHSIFTVASASQAMLLSRGEGNRLVAAIVPPVRRFVGAFIDRQIGGQPGALLKGLLLGVRGDIDPELREAFAEVGVIHVLAVSGLHVGFIAALLLGLLSFLRIPNPWRTMLAILGLFTYALLTGFKPPVLRAAIMATVLLVGALLQRRTNVINSLAVAAMIILTLNPLHLFEPGFQLSFVAVLGIALFSRRVLEIFERRTLNWQEKGKGWPIAVLTLAAVSLSAQLATLPLTAYYFNRLPLYSLPANLLVVPAVQIIVALGFMSTLFAALLYPLGTLLADAVWLWLSVLTVWVTRIADLPFASLTVPRLPPLWTAVFCLLCAALLSRRRRGVMLIAALLLVNVQVWHDALGQNSVLKVTFFDVGQGDAALLQFPNGRTMLVDAGDCTEYWDSGRQVILPYLRRFGIRKIDTLLLTHPHADHVGGAAALMQKVKIGRVVKTNALSDDPMAAQIDSLIHAKRLPVRPVAAGDTLLLDPDVLLMVLHPTTGCNGNTTKPNDCSIVLKVVYHGRSLLLSGDAEIAGEQQMLRFGDLLTSDVWKIGHHGSATASGQPFRQAVRAQYGVVSVAAHNRCGLPSKKLLMQMQNEGMRLLRTDQVGAVQIVLTSTGVIRLAKKTTSRLAS